MERNRPLPARVPAQLREEPLLLEDTHHDPQGEGFRIRKGPHDTQKNKNLLVLPSLLPRGLPNPRQSPLPPAGSQEAEEDERQVPSGADEKEKRDTQPLGFGH